MKPGMFWKDIWHRGQDAVEMKSAAIRLVVSRSPNFPGRWVAIEFWMGGKGSEMQLDGRDLEAAKSEALDHLRRILESEAHDWRP